MSARTLPGSRVEDMRAWMMATVFTCTCYQKSSMRVYVSGLSVPPEFPFHEGCKRIPCAPCVLLFGETRYPPSGELAAPLDRCLLDRLKEETHILSFWTKPFGEDGMQRFPTI